MRIILGKDFDSGVYPPIPEGKKATAGVIYAGPASFTRLLETNLGLSADFPKTSSRIIALANEISKISGFYDASLKADSYETALKLLQWRDFLRECGWRGQPVSPRLEQLAKVTDLIAKDFPGIPDRLEKIDRRLKFLLPGISEVFMLDPIASFSPAWQKIFASLKKLGVKFLGEFLTKSRIEESPDFTARIVMLSPSSAIEAATSVATWLANNPQIWSETVIVGGDSLLDAALARLGMPTLANASHAGQNSLLQLIPSFIDLFWNSDDPFKIQEFLSLPASPLPTSLRHTLARVLSDTPSTKSEKWLSAINDFFAKFDDQNKANELKQIVTSLFQQPQSQLVKKESILERLDLLKKLVCQQFAAKENFSELCGQLHIGMFLKQEELFRDFLISSPSSHFNYEDTKKFLTIATKNCFSAPLFPAQAGYFGIGNPGGMIAEAKYTIWWNFNFAEAGQPFTMPLTVDEKKKLAAAGVELPDYSLSCQNLAQLWKRPIENTSEMAVLVCPKKDRSGSPLTFHPIWNEIKPQLPANHANLILNEIPVIQPSATKTATTFFPPDFREKWQLPGFKMQTNKLSRKGLEILARCPFAFTMQYQARIKSGSFNAIPEKNLLAGNLFHKVIETLFSQKPLPQTLKEMKKRAASILDNLGKATAPVFFQPQGLLWKNAIENALESSLETLFPLLDPSKSNNNFESEKEITCNFLNFSLNGRVDFVHTDSPLVLDFKWDSFSRNWNSLQSGTAIQLLVYSWLTKEAENLANWPMFGYLICRSGKILANGDTLSGCKVEGPDPSIVWDSFVELCKNACDELNSGNISTGQDSINDNFSDEKLTLSAPCSFCDYAVLCGKRFE